jgi:hypothetical protein
MTDPDPWQVITDVTSELIRGGQTAGIRCRAALGVLERAGIDFDGNPVATAAQQPQPAPELAAERERADKAEAKAAAYENGITWGTSCLSCSAVLDSCIAETNRREGAEGKLAEAVLMLGEIREGVANFLAEYGQSEIPIFKVGQDLANAVLKIIDADAPADDDETPRPPRTTTSEGSAQ